MPPAMSPDERGRQRKRYPAANLSISVMPQDSHARLASGHIASLHYPSDAEYESTLASSPLRSPLLSHPKVRSTLRAVPELDADRLDRACGQSPLGSPTSSYFTPQQPFRSEHESWGRDDRQPPDSRRASASACHSRPLSPKRSQQSLRSSASEPLSLREQLLDADDAPPAPPVYRSPNATEVLRSLVKILRVEGKQIRDYIEIEDLLEEKEREARERESRLMETKMPPQGFRIFGASLKDAVFYASSPTVLGGYQHELPYVVYTCIEELYRTGMYQQGLFRILPTRGRLAFLMDAFDTRQKPTLRHETMPDICAVFMMYFDRLPEPLIPRPLFNALWNWCVKPTNTREEERRAAALAKEEAAFDRHAHAHALPNILAAKRGWRKRAVSEPTPPPEAEAPAQPVREQDEVKLERCQIAAAQHILRLLKPEAFSLLLYLCAFFTQIPLCPDNGLAFEDIARLFATNLLGGPSKSAAVTMMVWLLNRWERIADGLVGKQRGRLEADVQKKQMQQQQRGLGLQEMARGRSTSIAAPERKIPRPRSTERRRVTISGPPREEPRKMRATSRFRHGGEVPSGSSKTETGRNPTPSDDLQGPRPYSLSVSSDASTSTALSTSSSDSRGAYDAKPVDRESTMRDTREKVHPALPAVSEYDGCYQSIAAKEGGISSNLVDPEAFVPLPSEDMFRMDGTVYSSDSDSAYESDDETDTNTRRTSLRLPAGRRLASNSPPRRSPRPGTSPYRPSPLRDTAANSITVPTEASVSDGELSFARARISALEHALAMERCRSRERSSSVPSPGPLEPSDDAKNVPAADVPGGSDKDSILGYYIDPRPDTADGGIAQPCEVTMRDDQDDVQQQLQQALTERDHARKLVQQFRKVFENAAGLDL